MTGDLFQDLISDLNRDEGRRLKPYRCSMGKLTIGVGRNIEDNGISDDEADYLLTNDLRRCAIELDRSLSWWREMPYPWQRGLLNMCFNMGLPTLLTFKSTLRALKNGDGKMAAYHAMNSKWAKQVGSRAHRIADLYRSQ